MTSALYRTSKCTLVLGAGTRLPSRTDLTILRYIAAEGVDFFVVDEDRMVSAKLANTRASIKSPASALGHLISHFVQSPSQQLLDLYAL